MADNQLPEEKLLKLIRGEKGPKEKPKEEKPAKASKKEEVLKKNVSMYIIGLLVILIGGQSFYYLYESSLPLSDISARAMVDIPRLDSPVIEKKDFSYYRQTFTSRNIFKSLSMKTPEAPGKEQLTDGEILKKISLLGIVSGEEPQAIIEDKEGGQTHFLSPGDSFGVLKLEKIESGKVTINYDGVKVELSL